MHKSLALCSIYNIEPFSRLPRSYPHKPMVNTYNLPKSYGATVQHVVETYFPLKFNDHCII